QALVVVAATSLAAGSLGNLIALWRDRTFQALALTVLFLVLYLCLVQGLAFLPVRDAVSEGEEGGRPAARAQQWLDPFLALRAAQEPVESEAGGLAPAYGFALVMVGASVLLNAWALLRLRVWNPSGEPIMQREQPGEGAEEKEGALVGGKA